MEIIILTGMSGAGKSIAADYLEDMGYFCVDNLPPQLLGSLVRTFADEQNQGRCSFQRLAFVIDVRAAEFFKGTVDALNELKENGHQVRVIFLDCVDQVLISRYKQSRRNHPMGENQDIVQALIDERTMLAPVRKMADQVIDTSNLDLTSFRNYLHDLLNRNGEYDDRLSILIESFGFKYGIPADCDEVMDVRFIPNPYYDERLRPKSGLDTPVRNLVLSYDETQKWLDYRIQQLEFILPYYVREGKVRLTLGVGCTGGRHRSVALAEELARRLKALNYRVLVKHRDMGKDTYNSHERKDSAPSGQETQPDSAEGEVTAYGPS